MKKSILFLTALFLIFISGCSNSETTVDNSSSSTSNDNQKVNTTSDEYDKFFTKSFFEKRNKINLDTSNILDEFDNSTKGATIIVNNDYTNLNPDDLFQYFKEGHTKLEARLHLENLLDISLETIINQNNDILCRYYSIKTNDKIKIIENNIAISKEQAFDLNKNSLNQIVGYITVDISKLDCDFKKMIKDYADIYSPTLNLKDDILQINIDALTNEK